MPISAAISDWVMFLKNRSIRIFFSRGGSCSSIGLSDSRYSTPSRPSSSTPSVSATGIGSPPPPGRRAPGARPRLRPPGGGGGVQRQGAVGVGGLEAFQHLLVGNLEVGRELGDGGGAPLLLGQLAGGRGERE